MNILKRGWLVAALLILGCDSSDVARVRELNADLAAGLNRATKATIQLTLQGTLSIDEQNSILPHIDTGTILSDQITGCTDAAEAAKTLEGCVRPALVALRDEVNAATLGIKSPGAQVALSVILNGVLANIEAIGGVR